MYHRSILWLFAPFYCSLAGCHSAEFEALIARSHTRTHESLKMDLLFSRDGSFCFAFFSPDQLDSIVSMIGAIFALSSHTSAFTNTATDTQRPQALHIRAQRSRTATDTHTHALAASLSRTKTMTQPKDFCLFAAWITVRHSLYAPALNCCSLSIFRLCRCGCSPLDRSRSCKMCSDRAEHGCGLFPRTLTGQAENTQRFYRRSFAPSRALCHSLAHALAHSKISRSERCCCCCALILASACVFCVSVVYLM